MKADFINSHEWMTDWELYTSLLQVFIGLEMYTKFTAQVFEVEPPTVLIYFENGYAKGQFEVESYNRVGQELAEKAKDSDYLDKWCSEFKRLGEEIISAVNTTPAEFYKNFSKIQELYHIYGAYQFATKTAYNFLGPSYPAILEKLESARKSSERFYHDANETFAKIEQDIISKNQEYSQKIIDCISDFELGNYIKTGELPEKWVLENRFAGVLVIADSAGVEILPKEDFERVKEHREKEAAEVQELKGQVAQPGKATGSARIIKSYREADIKEGEILVAGMTDPNYLPLMKKAGAVVTDGGGLLCHAAIVCRELKKPCVIGTKVATQVLKDGMIVEVDANEGVVRILEK